jgi:hypothetical protein
MSRTARRLAACLLALCLAVPAAATEFGGERLTYEFGWQNIAAATAVITIDPATVAGKRGYHGTVKLQSQSRLEWIWRVRDNFTVDTTAGDFQCQRFLFQQREAAFAMDTEITRDAERGMLVGRRTRFKKDERKELADGEAPIDHFDPLSAILYLRSSNLATGKQFAIKVFDGKRRHDLTYAVLGEERIKIGLGEFDAWKVQPRIIRSSEVDKGSKVEKVRTMYLWVNKNEPHEILRIESEAFVGRIYVELKQKN